MLWRPSAGKLSLVPIAGGAAEGHREHRSRRIGDSLERRRASTFICASWTDPADLKISRLDIATGRQEPWKELKTPDPVGVRIADVVMTPDGNSYAYSYQRDIVTLFLVGGLK